MRQMQRNQIKVTRKSQWRYNKGYSMERENLLAHQALVSRKHFIEEQY
jgi:hypothetical protein